MTNELLDRVSKLVTEDIKKKAEQTFEMPKSIEDTKEKRAALMEVHVVCTLVQEGALSKSDAFRVLYLKGLTVGQISKVLSSHYSFVYGVISGTFGSVKTEGRSGQSKSDVIRSMADEGKTPGEIAKALNSNYSYVHSVVKKHRLLQEQQIDKK